MRLLITALLIVAGPALAQQAKTTEPQARSYVATALMTGAAPTILSDNLLVAPELRQRLGVAPDADNKALYQALVDLTPGKAVHVRRAAPDEVEKAQAAAPGRPMFAVEVGDATTLILQYDLARDHIVYAGLPPSAMAAATPAAPAAAVPVAVPVAQQTEVKPEPKPEPPAAVQKPEPPGLQVVEPQVPREPKPVAAAPARPAQPAPTVALRPAEPPRPLLRKSGPCEIKPVMSDQDLVNCGATPR